jgi:hypothetical protein
VWFSQIQIWMIQTEFPRKTGGWTDAPVARQPMSDPAVPLYHRPRNQHPQRARRGPPKTVGFPPLEPGADPGPAGADMADLPGGDVASPQPATRHGQPARAFPANAAPADGRSPTGGMMGRSRIRAEAGGAADGRPSLSRCPPLEPESGPRSAGRRHGRSARGRQRDAGERLQGQKTDRLVKLPPPTAPRPPLVDRLHLLLSAPPKPRLLHQQP